MSFSAQNKVALVTGANRGIGKAIVESLVKAGAAKVYAAVRDPATVQAFASASGGKVIPLKLDLAKADTITAAAQTAQDVQLVINNAGVLKTAGPLAPDAVEALQFEMEVNVYGLLRMAQAFAPKLAANGGGAFVQINSVVSMKTFADFTTYCASKAAAYAVTQGLRENLQPQGTLVVSVHPGPIATDMANDAGLAAIAEPPSLVGEAILASLAAGEFHCYPDSMAKKIGAAYHSFAASVIESAGGEG
jgi:NAD(P)-dependent dehydrogenase (short-subunit alcohol dehydrogenase family)